MGGACFSCGEGEGQRGRKDSGFGYATDGPVSQAVYATVHRSQRPVCAASCVVGPGGRFLLPPSPFSPPPRLKAVHERTSRLAPVISLGLDTPMQSSRVGATSPRTPGVWRRVRPAGALAMTKGTKLVVWEVLGDLSGVSISSALLRGVS